jgi:hypothetical protein
MNKDTKRKLKKLKMKVFNNLSDKEVYKTINLTYEPR